MKENKYDDINFFNQYSQMPRSIGGLKAAGEWPVLQKMLPDLRNKRVLDLGCGFGWHCQYAAEQGAKSVVGVDISEKMLEVAKKKHQASSVEYKRMAIEDIDFPADSFDIVVSSLALHYIQSFNDICKKVNTYLSKGGDFIFSVEHPIFTAYGKQDWYYDEQGNRMHWPVDRYFDEGTRKAIFLGEEVIKYHKTLTTYVNSLIKSGFELTELVEPKADAAFLKAYPDCEDELRRPMFLIISARKK
ncbi:methyltransferase domain-containing protein [Clostridium sp. A1-XYC3]|uniref:Methyltransferase domain-containing protein n=1 Tax=Clostridium tanneri TaxID=3037988 RepID=A0ABU4JQ23_9CLOT|nr:methyltransferase domain-containing protein [Clostridium sp. A1-XYC3]MDW8800230.1 methyltransferase domain-containing protein [Clostridium sp. A1-XYC3]